MSIDEAKEEFDFFNEGDYITREMATAKDIVLKKLHETEADLYEANKRITDLLLILGDRDRMIDLMADYIGKEDASEEFYKSRYNPITNYCDTDCRACVIKYFEERCKNAKD